MRRVEQEQTAVGSGKAALANERNTSFRGDIGVLLSALPHRESLVYLVKEQG
jgi:hypothetical protein